MDPLALLRSPTVSRMGWVMTLLARFSTVSGSVAENNARVICGPSHAATTASTCSTKPISNSLSASSSTRYCTALRLILFFSIRDLRRSGGGDEDVHLVELVVLRRLRQQTRPGGEVSGEGKGA